MSEAGRSPDGDLTGTTLRTNVRHNDGRDNSHDRNIEHVFQDDLDADAGQAAGFLGVRWSSAWDRTWPVAVMVLVVGSVVALLVTAIGLILPSHPSSAPKAKAKPHRAAPVTPVAMVAVRTGGDALAERAGPSTYHAVKGSISDGATVGVMCQVYGQRLTGTVTTSAWWEVDARGLYIADAWIDWKPKRPAIPWCGVSTDRAVIATANVGSDGLTVRSGPSSGTGKAGSVKGGTELAVVCRQWGQVVSGSQGTSGAWDKLGDGRYVADAYVNWSPEQPFIPWCGQQPQSVPPVTREAFIKDAVGPARESMRVYKVPASVTIAQAILESGTGVSTLTRVDHSLFGMKCFGSPGIVAVGCRDYATHECDSNGCYPTHASFRAYTNEAQSYTDHGLMLATLARYRPAFSYTYQPDKFAMALQAGGYATSRSYAKNLIALMKKYNLYQYDLKPPKPVIKAL